MPFYKLLCRRCNTAFETRASIDDRTQRRILCPECGNDELEPDYSAGSASVHLPKDNSGCHHSDGCGCDGCRCGCGSHGGR